MAKRIKIIAVVGARPNFIKIAPIAADFGKHKNVDFILVNTGQHYDREMSALFFETLKIQKPKYELNIGSGSHSLQIAKMLLALEKIFLEEKPNWVMVLGDVNSTLAGALAAAKLNFPVCHIESGLRSNNREMPEEINRVLTDHLSTLLFCPTKNSVINLKNEGIKKGVFETGDITYDVFLQSLKIAIKKSKIIDELGLGGEKYFLLTVHRAQNADNIENLKNIFSAIKESKIDFVFPVHPRTAKKLKLLDVPKNLRVINPVGYFDMLILSKNAQKIITDSGGLQKEAYWLKKPCLTLREETEWPETLNSKWNVLVGCDKKKILKELKSNRKLGLQKRYFGNGKAAKKITKIVLR